MGVESQVPVQYWFLVKSSFTSWLLRYSLDNILKVKVTTLRPCQCNTMMLHIYCPETMSFQSINYLPGQELKVKVNMVRP